MSKYLSKVASPAVLNRAWQQVHQNHKIWCADLSREAMQKDLIQHVGILSQELLAGTYRPEPMCCRNVLAKGVLCRSTLRDQMVQHAILEILEPICEFASSCQSKELYCLAMVREWVEEGYIWLGMANIKDCLETIPYEIVLKNLQKICGDKALVNIIRALIEQPDETKKGCGLPPGMLLTPFLQEVHLYLFDILLQNRQIPAVRVADDVIVFAEEKTGAENALDLLDKPLKKLGLTLNSETQVIRSSFLHKFRGQRLPNCPKRQFVLGNSSYWQNMLSWFKDKQALSKIGETDQKFVPGRIRVSKLPF